MNSLRNLFSGKETYPIVIIQYERAGYSVGQEEHLHWALIVISRDESSSGPAWQAIDRHYSDGRGVVWELFDGKIVHPENTTKCLGGVKIGTVKKNEFRALKKVLGSHPPKPKFEEWNCRDWVTEAISRLQEHGWIAEGVVPEQTALLVGLKEASKRTSTNARDNKAKKQRLVVVDFVIGHW